jgi:hypothetical protein
MRRLMRHGWQILLLVLAFGYALGPRTAHAQDTDEVKDLLEEPRSRQGYWVGFGGTYIGAGLREQGKYRGIYQGWTTTFRIGQLITRRLGLGLLVEYNPIGGGGISKGSDAGSLGGLTLEGSCLLWRDLSVHTGFGIGYVMVKDPNALDTSLRGGGGAYLLLGMSYDIFPWKRKTGGWALTPVIDFHLMPDGNIKFLSMMAGLQITWWSGLPDNMLRLPEE